MARAMEPLQQMGARFLSRNGGKLPCAMMGGMLIPITYTLPVPSAQVKSAVILAGLNTAGKTTVIEPEPTRDHTERMLQFLGVPCETSAESTGKRITITGQQQTERKNRNIEVAGDPSSAAFPMVAALITLGSQLQINNVGMNPYRIGLITTLIEMGANITTQNQRMSGGEEVADLIISASELKGITIPASRAPSMIDEYPILAIAAAFATGRTVMEGLAELRVKESNRLDKILQGLLQCGVTAEVQGDTLIVEGTGGKNIKGGAVIDSAHDHRIAMSFLILGLRSDHPIQVSGTETIATSFPTFFQTMRTLGVSISEQGDAHRVGESEARGNTPHKKRVLIAIDGPAASGKGTLARRLADALGLVYLDTGSLYRAVGMKLIYSNQDPHNKEAAIEAARNINLNDLQNPRLRQERIGNAASIVSAIPEVRQALLDFQHKIAASPEGAVLDGRDIGTVICPDADVKLFITANLEARTKRRHRELSGEGVTVVYESVLEDLKERDERDSKRSAAPLVPAADALIIDTSHLSADAVFANVLAIVKSKMDYNTQQAISA
jgi:3-phosphoshikimate 1-carboxyvinyltransferase